MISVVILRFNFEGRGLIAALHGCLSGDGGGLQAFCDLPPQRLYLLIGEQLHCLRSLLDAQLHRCHLIDAVFLSVLSELGLSEVDGMMRVLFADCFCRLGL